MADELKSPQEEYRALLNRWAHTISVAFLNDLEKYADMLSPAKPHQSQPGQPSKQSTWPTSGEKKSQTAAWPKA
jgi:hypothetical protein